MVTKHIVTRHSIIKAGDASKMGVGCEREVKIGPLIFHEKLNSISPQNITLTKYYLAHLLNIRKAGWNSGNQENQLTLDG
jgi:hypothetical protein